jgi:hypothetical protein
MTDGPSKFKLSRQCSRELLLGYLHNAGCPGWPGADCLTVEEVLRSYPQAARAGRVPNREQLLREYPDLEEELIAFFAQHDDS